MTAAGAAINISIVSFSHEPIYSINKIHINDAITNP